MPTHWVEPDDMVSMAGTKLPSSDWMTVEQDRINTFADCTEDHQFIHIDEEAAAKSPFGGTIAHGFLTLSLLTKLSSENSIGVKGIVMGVNYGIDKLRFLAPVRAGKRIRAHTEVLSVDRKDANRFLVKTAVTVEIEGEETPALNAEWLGMQFIA